MLRPAEHICWVVETRGVTLVSRDGAAPLSIPYPHAALWGVIADGHYTPQSARAMMALLCRTDEAYAEREIARVLAGWQDMGLVIRE